MFRDHFHSKNETTEVQNSRIINRTNTKLSRYIFHIEAIITLYFLIFMTVPLIGTITKNYHYSVIQKMRLSITSQ